MQAMRNAVILAALAGGTQAFAGQAMLTLLPVRYASDVTMDEFGRTLVLTSEGYLSAAYIWEDGLLTFIGNGAPWGISDDGSVVSGTALNALGEEEAARWTDAAGWETLGYLPNALTCPSRSSAYRLSGDGSTVVGLSWDGCNARAIKWTEATGMVEMAYLANGNARASSISNDGAVAVGFTQGTFARSPAVWNVPDGTASATYPFDPDVTGELWAVTPDGRTVAGRWGREDVTGFDLPAAYWNADEGVKIIGALDDDRAALAYDISADGRTIVGTSGSPLTGFSPFIWTAERGMENLRDRLVELGATIAPGVIINQAIAVTPDGRTIIGEAFVLPDQPGELGAARAFVATLPDPEPNPCPADLTGDGSVGFGDLTQLLNNWGPCTCVEDLDLNNAVGFSDLTIMLSAWGPCP